MGDKVGENPAALCAAVFLLSAKNRRGGVFKHPPPPPPSRAKVKQVVTCVRAPPVPSDSRVVTRAMLTDMTVPIVAESVPSTLRPSLSAGSGAGSRSRCGRPSPLDTSCRRRRLGGNIPCIFSLPFSPPETRWTTAGEFWWATRWWKAASPNSGVGLRAPYVCRTVLRRLVLKNLQMTFSPCSWCTVWMSPPATRRSWK